MRIVNLLATLVATVLVAAAASSAAVAQPASPALVAAIEEAINSAEQGAANSQISGAEERQLVEGEIEAALYANEDATDADRLMALQQVMQNDATNAGPLRVPAQNAVRSLYTRLARSISE